MLIRTFKSSYLIQYLLLTALLLILYLSGVSLSSLPEEKGNSLTFFPALDNFLSSSTWIKHPLFILIIAVATWFTNSTLTKFEMLPKNTLLGGLVFLLFWFAAPQATIPGSILISLLILVFYFYHLISIYDQEEPYDKVFNAGFLSGCAALLSFPSAIFFLLLPLSLFVYRISGWREWIISLLGFSTPALFLGTWFFWQDDLTGKMETFIHPFEEVTLNFPHFGTYSYVYLPLLGLILLMGLFFLWKKLNTITINNRRRFTITIWFMILSVISLLFIPDKEVLPVGYLGIPMAGILGFYYASLKKPFWHEWILFILLILIVLNRIFS